MIKNHEHQDHILQLNRSIHYILILGLVISIVFIITGVVLNSLNGSNSIDALTPLDVLLAGIMQANGTSFITTGILILIFTPIFRVIGSLFFFILQKDWKFSFATIVVLGIIVLIILLG